MRCLTCLKHRPSSWAVKYPDEKKQGFLTLGKEPLIEKDQRPARSIFEVIIVANEPDAYEYLPVTIARILFPANPLGGMHAG